MRSIQSIQSFLLMLSVTRYKVYPRRERKTVIWFMPTHAEQEVESSWGLRACKKMLRGCALVHEIWLF